MTSPMTLPDPRNAMSTGQQPGSDGPLDLLPQELLDRICACLDMRSLGTLASTSKSMCDRVISFIQKIPEERTRWLSLGFTASAFVYQRHMNRAIEIANMIPDRAAMEKGGTLNHIAEYLVKYGNIDKAIAVTRVNPHQELKWSMLIYIIRILALRGDVETAHSLIEEITPLAKKEEAQQTIAQSFAFFIQSRTGADL